MVLPGVPALRRCSRQLPPIPPLETQAEEGLYYVRQVVEGHAETIDRRSHLLSGWLLDLESGVVTGPPRRTYRVVVDTLAAAGDRTAAELQARVE